MPKNLNYDLRLFGDVSFGDLLQALAKTSVGDVQTCREWAMELLDLPFAVHAPAPVESNADDEANARQVVEDGDSDQQPIEPMPTKPDTPVEPKNLVLPCDVVRSERTESSGETPVWLSKADDLPGVGAAQVAARPALSTLFRPRTTRALLSTAFATPRGEGDIDMEEVLDQLTQLRPLTSLPRLPLSTLRLGLQLLIDRGQGTWPFYGDQEHVYDEILDVVGRDRVETLYFADCPLRGLGTGSRRTWSLPYEPPPPGTPVVLLSDLGLAGERIPGIGAGTAEWVRFAETLRDAECPLLALVPYGSTRWPQKLRRSMYILQWDRGTNVSAVRRLVGDGLVQTARA